MSNACTAHVTWRLPLLIRLLPAAACLALALSMAPKTALAQDIVPVTLTLEQAIDIARRNNPSLQATRNDESLADWEVKAAYGALLPSATTSAGVSWQGAGEQRFGSLTLEQLGFANQPSFVFSNYRIGLGYQIDGRTLLAPGQAKMNRNAARAQIAGAEATLIFEVTQGYIEVLRQMEEVDVSEQQLERASVQPPLGASPTRGRHRDRGGCCSSRGGRGPWRGHGSSGCQPPRDRAHSAPREDGRRD